MIYKGMKVDHVLEIDTNENCMWNELILKELFIFLHERDISFSSNQVQQLYSYFVHELIHHKIIKILRKNITIKKYAFGVIEGRKRLCPIKFMRVEFAIWDKIENWEWDYIKDRSKSFIDLLLDLITQLFIIPQSFKCKIKGFFYMIKEYLIEGKKDFKYIEKLKRD